jgi:hypothetical protein
MMRGVRGTLVGAAIALTLLLVSTSAIASTGYSHVVLALGPSAYWRLGETSGTTAYDASGHGRDATYQGDPTLGLPGAIIGDANTSVGFDGIHDDAVWVPNSTYRGAFTIVAWIANTRHTRRPEQTFFDTRTFSAEYSFDFKLSSGNLKVDVGNGRRWFLTGPGIPFDFQLGTWYQVAAVITRTHAILYVNGQSIGSEPYPYGTGTPLLFDHAHRVYLATNRHYARSERFIGQMDDIAVYRGSLSAQELATLYTVGSAG